MFRRMFLRPRSATAERPADRDQIVRRYQGLIGNACDAEVARAIFDKFPDDSPNRVWGKEVRDAYRAYEQTLSAHMRQTYRSLLQARLDADLKRKSAP